MKNITMELDKIKISNEQKHEILLQLKVLNEYCDKSERLSISEITFLKSMLPELIGLVPMKIGEVSGFKLPFERLVINKTVCGKNKRLKNLADLRYPPRVIQSQLDYNRASLKGQTVFYGGSRGPLPLSIEVQPTQGQLITESKWKYKGGILKMLVICQDANLAMSNPDELHKDYKEYERMLQQLEANTREVVEAFYKFVIKAFTRKVSPTNRQGYLFSALLSDLFFSNVDAIYYPSVPNNGSAMNIAIKPDVLDKQFQFIEASESIVVNNPRQNQWSNYNTGHCKGYNEETLELNWENHIIPLNEPVNLIIKEFNIDLT